jgi:hypothetical protein
MMRVNGVVQPDNQSCISSCIATFLGHTELTNPLKKVGRHEGKLVESDNKTLQPLGCEIEKCESNDIPDQGACLVLAAPPKSKCGHCFLFKDGELAWDPAEKPVNTWPNGWEISEVWKIESLSADTPVQRKGDSTRQHSRKAPAQN